MKRRTPWPWEGPEPVRASGDPVSAMGRLLLAGLPDHPSAGVSSGGELANRVSPRDTRDQIERMAARYTDGSPAALEWARERAETATRDWDRGVRSGRIQRS